MRGMGGFFSSVGSHPMLCSYNASCTGRFDLTPPTSCHRDVVTLCNAIESLGLRTDGDYCAHVPNQACQDAMNT